LLADLNIRDFLARTASKEPVPGGGSISALCASVAAALAEMVAALTVGRKGYEAQGPEMEKIAQEAAGYREKLAGEIDRDSEAYAEVMAAFRLPKETEEEKAERSKAVQQALKKAALVPLGVAEDAFQVMEMAGKVIEKGNRNAVTDGAVAVMTARTAVLGALYNVKINLGSIKDEDFVAQIAKRVESLEGSVVEKEREFLARVKL